MKKGQQILYAKSSKWSPSKFWVNAEFVEFRGNQSARILVGNGRAITVRRKFLVEITRKGE